MSDTAGGKVGFTIERYFPFVLAGKNKEFSLEVTKLGSWIWRFKNHGVHHSVVLDDTTPESVDHFIEVLSKGLAAFFSEAKTE